MRRNGPWLIEESCSKFKNKFVEVTEDRVVQPDGKPGTYATVRLNPGVAVLAITDDREVHLTRQFRYACGRECIEVVAGVIERDEDPRDAAKRELREELGIMAGEWTDLGALDPDTSILTGPARLFLARRLRETDTDPDPSEDIRRVTVSLDAAIQMVMNGSITHAPSCVAILKAARVLDQLRHHRLDRGSGSHA
jgi:8-oxo-dGTP pyrophosphatase MutT (NUDIX family)